MRITIFIYVFLLFVGAIAIFFMLVPIDFDIRYALYILEVSLVFSFFVYTVLMFVFRRYLKWMMENIKRAMDYIKNPNMKYPEERQSKEFIGNILEIFKKNQEEIYKDVAKRDEFIRWLTEEVNRCSFELNKQSKALIENEKNIALGHLVATLAHKLGTPLNSISGHIQLVLANNKLDYEIKNRLTIINQEIGRIEKLIRQALDVLIIDRHKTERINLKEFLSGVLDFLLPSLAKDMESIELNIEPDIADVHTDPDMLREVLINLISNANEAIQEKGLIKVLAGRLDKETYYIKVTDNGVGISCELKDKIFEPFYTTKQKGRASGLGLAICRDIARVLGGNITVESVVGKGSTFTFTFKDEKERMV